MQAASRESTAGTARPWWSNLSLTTLATVASVAVLAPSVGYLFHIAPLLRAGFSLDVAVAIYPTVAAANGFTMVAAVAAIVITFALINPAGEAVWRLSIRMWAMIGRPTAALERAAAPRKLNRPTGVVGLVLVALAAFVGGLLVGSVGALLWERDVRRHRLEALLFLAFVLICGGPSLSFSTDPWPLIGAFVCLGGFGVLLVALESYRRSSRRDPAVPDTWR